MGSRGTKPSYRHALAALHRFDKSRMIALISTGARSRRIVLVLVLRHPLPRVGCLKQSLLRFLVLRRIGLLAGLVGAPPIFV